MARMAALSAAGSFAQAVITWDKSCPALTRLCEATCEGETVLAASLLGSWRVHVGPTQRSATGASGRLRAIFTLSNRHDQSTRKIFWKAVFRLLARRCGIPPSD